VRKINFGKIKHLDNYLIILIVFLSIVFWDSIIIYPIKLLVVLLHEISHGIAAIVSGGHVEEININFNLGGECLVNGGNQIFVASAGYLGSLLFGGLLFYTGYSKKQLIISTSVIAFLIIYFAANYISGAVGIVFAIFYFLFLLILPRSINPNYNKVIFASIGLISCLYVLTDIKEDLLTLEFRATDAQILSDLIGFPSLLWGLVWLIISILFIYYLLKKKLFNFK